MSHEIVKVPFSEVCAFEKELKLDGLDLVDSPKITWYLCGSVPYGLGGLHKISPSRIYFSPFWIAPKHRGKRLGNTYRELFCQEALRLMKTPGRVIEMRSIDPNQGQRFIEAGWRHVRTTPEFVMTEKHFIVQEEKVYEVTPDAKRVKCEYIFRSPHDIKS